MTTQSEDHLALIEHRLDIALSRWPFLRDEPEPERWHILAAWLVADDDIFGAIERKASGDRKPPRANGRPRKWTALRLKALARAWRGWRASHTLRSKTSRNEAVIRRFRKGVPAALSGLEKVADSTLENRICEAEHILDASGSPALRAYIRVCAESGQKMSGRWAVRAMRKNRLTEEEMSQAAKEIKIASYFGRRALTRWTAEQK